MLNVKSTGTDECVTYGITGELALESVDVFTKATALTLPGTRRVVLDCEGLTFVDSTGVNALLKAVLAWKRGQIEVEIHSLGEDLREMLEVLGFFEVLREPS